MPREKLFLDTSFILAFLDPKDSLNVKAKGFVPRLNKAQVWVTEAVLIEVGNAFSSGGKLDRDKAVILLSLVTVIKISLY